MANFFPSRNRILSRNNEVISGSLTVLGGITGSLYNSASVAVSASYALSSSYALSASYVPPTVLVLSASYSLTSSYVLNAESSSYSTYAVSASYAPVSATASYVNPLHQDVILTGSYYQSGSMVVNGDITSTGTLTAQRLVVQTISSSIIYSSGSNIFGSVLTDVQSFTGSLRVTGSGNHWIMGGNVGIGDVTPSTKLEIYDSTAATIKLNNGTYYSTISQGSSYITAFSMSYSGKISWGAGGSLNFNNNEEVGNWWFNSATGFYTDTSMNGVYAGGSGKLGFYTYGSTTVYGAISASWADNSNAGLQLYYKSGSLEHAGMTLTKTGYVGLGMNTPSYSLDIAGITRIGSPTTSGQLYIKGGVDLGQYIYLDNGGGNVWTIVGGTAALAIRRNGVPTFYIGETRNVGLSNDSPQFRLDVSGSGRFTSNLTVTGSLRVNGNVIADSFTGSFSGSLAAPGSDRQVLINNGGILGASSDVIITAVGRIGLGTTAPTGQIEINGANAGFGFKLARGIVSASFVSNGTDAEIGTTTNSSFKISANNISRITIDKSDAVTILGIGATSSTKTLVVQNANLSSSLTILDNGSVRISNVSTNVVDPATSHHITGSIHLYRGTLFVPYGTPNFGTSGGGITFKGSAGDYLLQQNASLYSYYSEGLRLGLSSGSNTVFNFVIHNLAYREDQTSITTTSSLDPTIWLYSRSHVSSSEWVNMRHNTRNAEINVGTGSLLLRQNVQISGSLLVSGSITGSFSGSLAVPGSDKQVLYNNNGVLGASSDLVITAARRIGIGTPLPSASLHVSGTAMLNNALFVNETSSSLASGSRTVASNATSSYDSGFYKYMIKSESHARSGQLIVVWNGSSIQYTDYSTLDIGITSNIEFTASLSGANVNITTVFPTDGWTIKTLSTFL